MRLFAFDCAFCWIRLRDCLVTRGSANGHACASWSDQIVAFKSPRGERRTAPMCIEGACSSSRAHPSSGASRPRSSESDSRGLTAKIANGLARLKDILDIRERISSFFGQGTVRGQSGDKSGDSQGTVWPKKGIPRSSGDETRAWVSGSGFHVLAVAGFKLGLGPPRAPPRPPRRNRTCPPHRD